MTERPQEYLEREAVAQEVFAALRRCGIGAFVAAKVSAEAINHLPAARVVPVSAIPELARQWALDNVRRAARDQRTCEHKGTLTADWSGCIDCVFDLGRSMGHAEAGATIPLDEAMAELRRRAPVPPVGDETTEEETK